jgi:hypothetical protein
MLEKAVAQLLAVVPAGFRGCLYLMAFAIARRRLQAGHYVILGIDRQNEGEDDAISFLTGH